MATRDEPSLIEYPSLFPIKVMGENAAAFEQAVVQIALHDRPITIHGDGAQTRSFQFVSDLVKAIRGLMELSRETLDAFCTAHNLLVPVVNTGNPDEYTIRQLAEEVLALLPESRSQLIFGPLPADDPPRRRPDITLARELLDWAPRVPLRTGLEQTIAYFRER